MLGTTYSTVLPLAEELASKGITLTAVPSSIISELCSHSIPAEFEAGKKFPRTTEPFQDVQTYGMLMDWNTQGESGLAWGSAFDNSSHQLALLIKTHIEYIRNVVGPRVVEFTKDSNMFLQDLGSSNPAEELEIVKVNFPEVTQEAAFLALLSNFNKKQLLTPKTSSMNFNVKTVPENFLSVASTSNARLDNMVAAWNSASDMNYLRSAWYSFFAGNEIVRDFKGPYFSQEDLSSPNIAVRLNVGLAYFLIANYYTKNMPDIVTSESTPALKDRLYDHLSFSGTGLSAALNMLDQNNKSNILVCHIDTNHQSITVSGSVYDLWLQTGGSAELIMGILVGAKQYYSVKDIDANADKLKKAWKDYTSVYLESIEYKKADSLRAFYISLLKKYMTPEYTDSREATFKASNPQYNSTSNISADEWVRKLPKAKLVDTAFVAKELIAGRKFHFTYGKKFLDDMELVAHDNDNMIPEEAAMVATINYIVDFLQVQIRAVRA